MEQGQCLKGINLATSEFGAEGLILAFKNQTLFKIPFDKIQNSQIINKNDVTLEFPYEDADPNDDVLCEMRLAFNTKTEGEKEKDKEEKKVEEEVQTQAEIFNGRIMSRAKIGENAGDSIVTLLELPLIIPRGKYTCDMYNGSLKLHGATYNFIVQYKHIQRAFLLPKPDEMNMLFVLGLEKPMRQGSTSYPYIIMQFKKDLEDTVKPRLSKDELKDIFGGNLQEEYDGPFFEIVVKIFKTIVGINVIIPGTEKNPGWKSTKGHSAVKCSVKANEGHLYFLQKSLLFINKPVIYIKIEEVNRVEFQRITSTTTQNRMFDLDIVLKNGQTHTFVGLEKKELQLVIDYFQQKKIQVKMTEDPAGNLPMSDDSQDDGDDREAKGKRKIKPRKIEKGEIDEDDDEEDDEDFIADDDGDDDEEDDEDEDFEEEDVKKPAQKPDA